MSPVRRRDLVVLAAGLAVASWLLVRSWYGSLPSLDWWLPAPLALLAVAVFVHTALLRHTAFPAYCSDLSESAAAVHRAAGTLPGFLCRWGATPDDLHKGQHLETLLTSTFVHAGWFHLLSNLLFLLAFAPRVEEDAGHAGLLAEVAPAPPAGAMPPQAMPMEPGVGAPEQ